LKFIFTPDFENETAVLENSSESIKLIKSKGRKHAWLKKLRPENLVNEISYHDLLSSVCTT